MTCRKCDKPLPTRKPGPGRPPIYCSTGCRRAAEYEIRRTDTAIRMVEDQIRCCRFGWNGRTEADLSKFEAELARLDARMRVLLDEDEARALSDAPGSL